jgi:hypothetical protein
MPTDRQMVANKANALKSTGPTTAQGKAAARRNALKHGMTCEKENLFSSDAILFKDRLEGWTKTVHPRNDLEHYQIECAVRATVNLDRCARNANAEMDKRTRQAVGHWEGVQTKKINQATKHWTTRPANCVAQLETFARGVEWLLARWEELAQALEANKCWTRAEAWNAMRLMGKCPEVFNGDGEVASFRNLVIAAWPEIAPGAIDALLHIDTASLEPEAQDAVLNQKLPSREEALQGLWATLDAELERLVPIREKLWESEDGPRVHGRWISPRLTTARTACCDDGTSPPTTWICNGVSNSSPNSAGKPSFALTTRSKSKSELRRRRKPRCFRR